MNFVYNPCPCNSGRKFKFCCKDLLMQQSNPSSLEIFLTKLPMDVCLAPAEFESLSMCSILVARKLYDHYVIGGFLIDRYCLGVKDAYLKIGISLIEWNDLQRKHSGIHENVVSIPYKDIRNFILGSIEFAAQYGFEPHPDYKFAKVTIESEQPFEKKYEYGDESDGKPFYIEGPYDANRSSSIRKKVNAVGGRWICPVGTDFSL